jgi:class 3 adenylate cyclase/tetratricopeptide (TPR) repeat protein
MNVRPHSSAPEQNAEQKRQHLDQAAAGLEAQRALLGDLVVDSALEALRRQLAELGPLTDGRDRLAGERKLITVMFADISGYTALAEKIDPERARDLLNDCFEHLVPMVEKYGGTIDKFVGDEIVALFGAPVAHENDAERACAAALEMMAALADFNQRKKADLGLHFGINTGHVVAGDVGTSYRHDYSVTGHAVNLAAHLEDASSRGEIFVGAQTQRMAAPFFEFEEMTLEVKGTSAPVTAFRLLRARESIGSARGLSGRFSSLVGRERELGALQKLLKDLQRRCGAVAALFGEAGIGKSRLTAELRARAGELKWYEGRSLSHTRGMSYWLARDIVRNLLGIGAMESSSVGLKKLRETLEEVIGEKGLRFHPFLARFLELPLDEHAEAILLELTPEALHRETFEAVAAFVLALAVIQPLVIVCEDLHWADPSSLQLVEKLLPLTASAPLLLLLVLRRDDDIANAFLQRIARQFGDRFQQVNLEPLSSAASQRLLQNLLKVGELPAGLARLILSKTEGNAFFLEEVLRSLIDEGVIKFCDGKAKFCQEVQTVNVPDTVHGVLASRIDRLPAAEKNVLQTAAVLGRVFDEKLLVSLVTRETGRNGLRDSLEDLVSREFLRHHTVEGEPDDSHRNGYIFKHALTHEVSYQSLLLARRKDLHRRAAEAIEELWEPKLDEQAAALGQHFAKAELPVKAVEYLKRAGDRAASSYANEEAIGFYRQALEQIKLACERDDSGSFRIGAGELQERAGDLLQLIGKQEEARDSYASALAEIENEEPAKVRVSTARLYRKIAKTHETQHNCDEALRQYDQAEAILRASNKFSSADWAELIETRLGRIWAHYFKQAALEKMVSELDELRGAVELHGTSRQRADFLHHEVLSRFRRERFVVSDETLALALRGLELQQQDGDILSLGHSHFSLGLARICRFEPNEAKTQLQAALNAAERTGDLILLSRSLNYLVMVERVRQDANAAGRAVKRLLPLVTREKMTDYIGVARATLGWIAWRAGDETTAGTEAKAALEVWAEGLPYPFKWTSLWPLIAIAIECKDVSAAAKYSQQLLDPLQQPLPIELAACVAEIIKAHKSAQEKEALEIAGHAVQLARKLQYL